MSRSLSLAAAAFICMAAAVISGCGQFSAMRETSSRPARETNPQPAVIVCFGDSLTAGEGAAPEEAYPAVLQQKVNAVVINSGVPGETAGEAFTRIHSGVLSHNPQIVIVELGANDFLDALNSGGVNAETLSKLDQSYKDILKALKDGRRKICLVKFYNEEMGAYFLGGNMEMYKTFDSYLNSLAAEYGAQIIDGIWDGIWGNPALMSDAMHPNAAGYKIMADNYLKALKQYLEAQKLLK